MMQSKTDIFHNFSRKMQLVTNDTKHRQYIYIYISNQTSQRDKLIRTTFESEWRLRREKQPMKAMVSRCPSQAIFPASLQTPFAESTSTMSRKAKAARDSQERSHFSAKPLSRALRVDDHHAGPPAPTKALGTALAHRSTFREPWSTVPWHVTALGQPVMVILPAWGKR